MENDVVILLLDVLWVPSALRYLAMKQKNGTGPILGESKGVIQLYRLFPRPDAWVGEENRTGTNAIHLTIFPLFFCPFRFLFPSGAVQ